MALDQQALEAALHEADRWDTGMVSRSGQPSRYFVARRDEQDDHIQVSEHTQHFEARDEMERQMMGAAITAYIAALGDGWRLVPVEPTEAMIEAGFNVQRSANAQQRRAIWAAMLAAAPTPPGEKK